MMGAHNNSAKDIYEYRVSEVTVFGYHASNNTIIELLW